MKKNLLLVGILATVLTTSAFASTYDTSISSFKTRADAIVKEVNSFKPTGTYQQQMTSYRAIDLKIDRLDNDMDYYENTLKRDYRAGKINYNTYRSLDRQLETIEYSFDDLDDELKYKIRSVNTPAYVTGATTNAPNAPAANNNTANNGYYQGNGYYDDDFNDYYDDDRYDDDRYDDDRYDDDRYDDDRYDHDDRYGYDD